MTREKNHPDFELMDKFTRDEELAEAVVAVGRRARREGYQSGFSASRGVNTVYMVLALIAGIMVGFLCGAAFFLWVMT